MDPVAQPPDLPTPPAAPTASEATTSRRTFLAFGTLAAAGLALTAVGASMMRGAGKAGRAVARTLPRAATTLPPAPADPAATTPGLSPLLTPNADFYRIDVAASVPTVDTATWTLTVDGQVARPATYTYDQLLAMPLVEVDATLSCVSNPVNGHEIGTARWTGVRLSDIVKACAPSEGVEQAYTYGADGFTAGFPAQAALQADALVAVGMNGQTLPAEHGFPVRLVVPGLFGYVSATKWLTRIEFASWSDRAGFWIPRGWSRLGPVKTEARIDVPRQGASVAAGTVTVAGMAWCAGGAPSRVDVRVDDREWQAATLGPVLSEHAWRQWWLDVALPAGRSTVTARAYDAAGVVQTEKAADVVPDGATGWPSVVVDVA